VAVVDPVEVDPETASPVLKFLAPKFKQGSTKNYFKNMHVLNKHRFVAEKRTEHRR